MFCRSKFLDFFGRFKTEAWICLGLIVSTLLVYRSLIHADFVNFDDYEYVTRNPHVRYGFSWAGVIWAFEATYASNWHPLTWLSHMLDCQVFGVNAGPHHMVNVALHAANLVLVFLIFRNASRQVWPSAFLAALFALHPLRVESVAWISERKDVLSSFFGLLSMWAYIRYTQRRDAPQTQDHPNPITPQKSQPLRFYLISLLLFACALMAKPMVVTLPFLFLLLDVWPLARLKGQSHDLTQRSVIYLFLEKIPFLALSAAVCFATIFAHKEGILGAIPLKMRFANASIAYLRYIRKIIWPTDLAPLYTYPNAISGIAIAYAVLIGISLLAVLQWRRRPYWFVGWFWFIGTIVPVSGIIQTGSQALADRYTYWAATGLFVVVIWSILPLLKTRLVRFSTCAAATLFIVSYATCTSYQVQYWQNSLTLFGSGLLNDKSAVMERYVATALSAAGHMREAGLHFSRSLELNPDDASTITAYACYLSVQGRYEESLPYFKKAISGGSATPFSYFSYANALFAMKRFPDAEANFRKAIQLNPEYMEAYSFLAVLLSRERRFDDAAIVYQRMLEISPRDQETHFLISRVYAQENRMAQAIAELELTLAMNPQHASACNDLAWILASDGSASLKDAARAVVLARKACALNPESAGFLDTLGVAYGACGKFDDAVSVTQSAKDIAVAHKDAALVAELEKRITQYRKHLPYKPSL